MIVVDDGMIFSRLVAMLPDPLQIPAWKHRARKTSVGYDVEVFYDGDCPLCLREINMLRRKDSKGKIQFTNIADAEFHSLNVGKTYDELMLRIHGRLPDGTWIEGVEVFRRLYKAVGFGPLVAVTRLPIISQVMDLGYVLFARNRLRLTGRCQAGTCDIKSKTGTGE